VAFLWVGFFRFHGLLAAGAADPAREARTPAKPPRREGPHPSLVVHRGVVWDADRPAREQGVRPGQEVAAARAACPEAARRPFDPAADAARLSEAWDLLAEASSTVEPDPDGRPEACAAWPGGSPPLAELGALDRTVRRRLPHVDLAGGLAGSVLVARLACPPGRGVAVVDAGREELFLSGRPLRELVDRGLISPALGRRLEGMGLIRCGQVASLPESALAGRFGREGRRLHRLCRGLDGRPVRPLHPPRALAARRSYPDGIPPDARADAAAGLARRAAGGLRPGEGVGRLCVRGDGGAAGRAWNPPCRDPAALARAAAELASGLPGETGRLEVRLEELAPAAAEPLDLLDGRARPGLDDLLARWPRGALRRGWGGLDRHEALLALLDPWRSAP
jgi:hypothetical protein